MSRPTLAQQLIEVLRQAGVERVYGVVGDSLNPVVDAIRRTGRHRVDPRTQRGGGRIRRRRRGAADRAAGGLRGQLRSGQHPPDPGAVRRPPHRGAGARDRVAHPDPTDRHRLLPGDPPGAAVRRVQPLLRTGQPPGADAAAGPDRGSAALGAGGVAVLVMPGDVFHAAADAPHGLSAPSRSPGASCRPTSRCRRSPSGSTPPRR